MSDDPRRDAQDEAKGEEQGSSGAETDDLEAVSAEAVEELNKRRDSGGHSGFGDIG